MMHERAQRTGILFSLEATTFCVKLAKADDTMSKMSAAWHSIVTGMLYETAMKGPAQMGALAAESHHNTPNVPATVAKPHWLEIACSIGLNVPHPHTPEKAT